MCGNDDEREETNRLLMSRRHLSHHNSNLSGWHAAASLLLLLTSENRLYVVISCSFPVSTPPHNLQDYNTVLDRIKYNTETNAESLKVQRQSRKTL